MVRGAVAVRPHAREWVARFLTHLRLRGSISAACVAAKVSRRTAYDERARNPLFHERIREIAEECVEEVESTLYRRAIAGGTTEIIFFLKCHEPEVYGDRLRAEHEHLSRYTAHNGLLASPQRELSDGKIPPHRERGGHDAPCWTACSSALAISSDGRTPRVAAGVGIIEDQRVSPGEMP